MSDNNFDDWVVVYEIGNPTKFVLCYFDGSEAFLETVVDGRRRDSGSGTWTDVQVLQKQFVVVGNGTPIWTGKWKMSMSDTNFRVGDVVYEIRKLSAFLVDDITREDDDTAWGGVSYSSARRYVKVGKWSFKEEVTDYGE